ncbi:hypothetical protein ACFFP0_20315 [Rhizobium puerariae]|uniref:Uncharacterized protein n=1 Tax=Rhizobium puerariae TaxID=1585791 RepID=A0ABV6AKP6_9HYPH
MTATFLLKNEDSKSKLLSHLAQFRLIPPQNCAVTFYPLHAIVSSQHSFALGSARTAW